MHIAGLIAVDLLGRSITPPEVPLYWVVVTMLAPPESAQPPPSGLLKVPPGASVYQSVSPNDRKFCVSGGVEQVDVDVVDVVVVVAASAAPVPAKHSTAETAARPRSPFFALG